MSDNSNTNIIESIGYILAEKCVISEISLQNGFFSVETDFSEEIQLLPIVPLSGRISFQDSETDHGIITAISLSAKLPKLNQSNNTLVRHLNAQKHVFIVTDVEGSVYLVGNKHQIPKCLASASLGDASGFRGYNLQASLAWQYGLVLSY